MFIKIKITVNRLIFRKLLTDYNRLKKLLTGYNRLKNITNRL